MIELDIGATFGAIWDWAWARHGNVLSWYIRPLFLIPLALAAYRRSILGIVGAVVAMLSSMAWFPAPAAPDPRVQEFLAFEQEWLSGGWNAAKVAITVVVPLSLTAYCAAFWKRSLRWGLAVLAFMALGKILWSVAFGGESGSATIVPALAGLGLGGVVLAVVLRRSHRRNGPQVADASTRPALSGAGRSDRTTSRRP